MKIITLFLIALFLSFGCKAREPDEAGFLDKDSSQSSGEDIAANGAYRLNCSNDSNIGDDQTADTYLFEVEGAANPADEAQPLRVSVVAVQKGVSNKLFADVKGRGAIALGKSIFVGFEQGALTGEPTVPENASYFTGIMSIAGLAEGLQVSCHVEATKSDQG